MIEERKRELIQAANMYSDIAVNERDTKKAAKKFWNDYLGGKWNIYEHILLMVLTQKYIDCKCGVMTRAECLEEQRKAVEMLDEYYNLNDEIYKEDD